MRRPDHPRWNRPAPSTDPPSRVPRQELAIRETLLWRFQDPDDADTVRKLGELLHELLNESGQWGAKDFPHPLTFGTVEAIAADLAHLVELLQQLADTPASADLEEAEFAVCGEAKRWAGQLTQLVLAIRAGLEEQRAALRP